MDIHQQLKVAVQQASLRVVGHQDIYDIAEIQLLQAILAAFGQSPRGFLYVEPALLDSQVPPPDVVLVHPDVGLVVFECKAYDIGYIQGIEAGNLKIARHGREELVNPLRQAQRGMFAIKDAFEQYAPPGPRPLFHAMVALPNIDASEWHRLGYHRSLDGRVVIFRHHLEDPQLLREHIGALIQQTRQRVVNMPDPYPPLADSVFQRVFGDSAVLNEPRELLRGLGTGIGAEIDQIEQSHKQLSAEQEHLSRMDTWGAPFLVRGVAGSGKSIVLANQVARTLYRHQQQRAQLSLFEDTPEDPPKLGVLCFNRSLVPLLQERISRAYQGLTGQGTLPENIIITDLNRLLYSIAERIGNYKLFQYVNRNQQAAERARKHLDQLEALRLSYPAIFDPLCFDGLFIDEGQDAHPDEYRLLYNLIRPNPTTGERSITIFYDDAQNLYGNPPPTWRNLSLNVAGGRAAFMQQCYRNSREIIELGLNVLMGTHAKQKVRVASRRFVDIDSLEQKQLVSETAQGWQISYAESSGIAPIVRSFSSRFEQLDWAVDTILALMEGEHVRPEHILVLAPRSSSFRYLSQRLTQLAHSPIPLRLVGGNYQQFINEALLVPGQLTLATLYNAKGHDAPVVFMLDTDHLETGVLGRVAFYVGVTRAKRYLFVSGLDTPQTLLQEALQHQNQAITSS